MPHVPVRAPRVRRVAIPCLLLGLVATLATVAWAQEVPADATTSSTAPPDSGFLLLGEQRPFQAEVITELVQDRVGFLWIGTREGLFQYDGQRFRKFQHDAGDADSISSNAIRGMLEDTRGRLWVNTISGGLNLLDRAGWTFRHFNHGTQPGGLSHDGVFALAEAEDGRLWVGTQSGLDLLDPATGLAEPRALRGKGGEFIMTLLRDAEGRLWVGTLGQGLFRATDAGGFEAVPLGEAGDTGPADIFGLMQDAGGVLWVGARDGLYRVAPGQARMAAADLLPVETGEELVNVTTLVPDTDGAIWIGTFGTGLYRLDPATSRIEAVGLGRAGAGAQHVDQGAMLVDRQGGLLVGTFGAGLLRRPAPVLDIQSYRAGQGEAMGLRGEDVYAVLADGGDMRFGSFGGGVQRLVGATGEVQWLDAPEADGRRLDGVVALARSRDGSLWVGTSAGLYRRRPDGGTTTFTAPPGSPGEANPGYVYAMLEDHAGRLWVGSGGSGLYRFRPGEEDFLIYRPEPGNPRALSDDFVSALMEDRRGRLWVGTRSGGLNLCTVAGDALDCEQLPPGQGAGAPSHHHVADLLEAPDGAVWIGTGGGGLNRVDLDADGRIIGARIWTRADGLVDDNVMALAHAPDGALWITTRVGLSRLDPDGHFDNYTVADGLPTSVFNAKAADWLDGRLYLGGTRGVVSIDPARWQRPGPPPPTVFTSIEGLERATPLPAPPWQLESLRVAWRQPFSLGFSVLSFDGGEAEYEYRLDDGEPWTPLGNRNQLTLHSLSPGRYRVGIRGRHAGTGWTASAPLSIDIVPPWWRNAWLQAAAIVLAFALVLLGAVWRVRALQARNAELQALERQKDVALQASRDSQERLESAFARLRRLTMQLEAAKEEERKHIARELHDEFGQALTAAKINLRLALANSGAEAAEARIDDTLHVIERLIVQVRALSLDLRPPLLDELGLVPALEGYLDAVAQRSGMAIERDIDVGLPAIDAERAIAVFRVVQEALTNALRHAEAAHVRVVLKHEDGAIGIEVADDGRGFDAEGAMEGRAHGFGLFGMGERIKDLGGRFALNSRPGRGTVILATVPLANAARPGLEATRT